MESFSFGETLSEAETEVDNETQTWYNEANKKEENKTMKEVIVQIGSFTIYGYGLMIAIGIVLAFWVAMFREKKYQIGNDQVFSLGMWCLVGGWASAKLLFLITELPSLIADPKQFLATLSNGFVVYGGLIGGILTGWLFCRIKKLSFLKYFDLVMPSIALAQAFGRIGCFLAGCCYGKETTSAFHVIFPAECRFAPGGIPLIPTQLLSSAGDFLNFFALLFCAKKTKSDGQVGGFYLIFYSIGRFVIECFRDDPRGKVGMLSTSQFIAVFMLIAGIAIVAYCGKKYPKKAEDNEAENKDTGNKDTENKDTENNEAEKKEAEASDQEASVQEQELSDPEKKE